MNDILLLLFSAGGAAFIAALTAGIKSLRTSRIETEEALITRLNNAVRRAENEASNQRHRAERAEEYSDQLRKERDVALDLAARRHRQLIEAGIDPD